MTSQRRFRIIITAWIGYQIELPANSAEDAITHALRLYETDIDRFEEFDDGIGNYEVEKVSD